MTIEFQYFDGCPHAGAALDGLYGALADRGLSPLRLTVRRIADEGEAEAVGFQGSPTILVNGLDLATGLEPVGFRYSCRLYQIGGQRTGAPSRDYIAERLAILTETA